jgi:hypothetical protein
MLDGQWLSRIALDFLLDRSAAELSQASLRDAPESDSE